MSRINTNVNSLIGQRVLTNQNNALNTSLERLSTGFRINRGKDDPAGLIASETLRSEKAAISAAIGNAERADQIANIAEGGLQEISSLLTEVQSLVGQTANDAGLSQDEKDANQLQIDSILQTIDRIASSTSFQGTKLLNGNFDFTVSGKNAAVEDFQINAAKIGFEDNRTVQVTVTNSAQNAGLLLSAAGTSLVLDGDADSRLIFEVAGALGSREFTFSSGTTLADAATQINTFKDAIGVSAVVSGNGLVVKSTDFGDDQFVAIDVIDDGGATAGGVALLTATDNNTATATGFTTFANAEGNGEIRDAGQNIGAIVNGITATAQGKNISVNTDFLALELDLSDTGAQTLASFDALTVTGGGATFNLGPNVNIENQVSLGLGNVAARELGSVANGFLDELNSGRDAALADGDLTKAQNIVNDAVKQVATLRGRIGSFQKNTVGSTINALNVALENVSAAESAIRDTDFAAETANLTRSQILVAAATNVLGISNSQPQNVLGLIG